MSTFNTQFKSNHLDRPPESNWTHFDSKYKSSHCHYWIKTGCRQGNLCRFYHMGNEDDAFLRSKGYNPPHPIPQEFLNFERVKENTEHPSNYFRNNQTFSEVNTRKNEENKFFHRADSIDNFPQLNSSRPLVEDGDKKSDDNNNPWIKVGGRKIKHSPVSVKDLPKVDPPIFKIISYPNTTDQPNKLVEPDDSKTIEAKVQETSIFHSINNQEITFGNISSERDVAIITPAPEKQLNLVQNITLFTQPHSSTNGSIINLETVFWSRAHNCGCHFISWTESESVIIENYYQLFLKTKTMQSSNISSYFPRIVHSLVKPLNFSSMEMTLPNGSKLELKREVCSKSINQLINFPILSDIFINLTSSLLKEDSTEISFVDIYSSTLEYQNISRDFFNMSELGSTEIVKIQRVLHPVQAKFYELRKSSFPIQSEIMLVYQPRFKINDNSQVSIDKLKSDIISDLQNLSYTSDDTFCERPKDIGLTGKRNLNNTLSRGVAAEGSRDSKNHLVYIAKFLIGNVSFKYDYPSWLPNPLNPSYPTNSSIDNPSTFTVFDKTQMYIGYVVHYRTS